MATAHLQKHYQRVNIHVSTTAVLGGEWEGAQHMQMKTDNLGQNISNDSTAGVTPAIGLVNARLISILPNIQINSKTHVALVKLLHKYTSGLNFRVAANST